MSELECPFCGMTQPLGIGECSACGAPLRSEPPPQEQPPAPEEPPEPEVPAEPASEIPAPEPASPEPQVVRAAEPPAQPPASSSLPAAPPQATPEAAPAPSGDTPSIADLVPCPNPGCFGVVAPGDGFCTFCGGRLPAAPPPATPPADLPPPEPLRPASSSGAQPAGGVFHIPRGVWIVLAILPLGVCALLAVLVLNAVGAPPWVMGRDDIPEVQKEAERVAWPSGTPTRAPTATSTATRTATVTPTATGTPGSGQAPAGPTARTGTPTLTPEPGWKPAPLTLGKGVQTVPVTADNLFTGVTVYYLDSTGTNSYVYEVMGRADNCRSMKSGRGVMLRRADGLPYWVDWDTLVNYLTRPSANPSVIRADDPGLQAKQWLSYPCPQ